MFYICHLKSAFQKDLNIFFLFVTMSSSIFIQVNVIHLEIAYFRTLYCEGKRLYINLYNQSDHIIKMFH